jgi:hypothetical protein
MPLLLVYHYGAEIQLNPTMVTTFSSACLYPATLRWPGMLGYESELSVDGSLDSSVGIAMDYKLDGHRTGF